MKIQALTKLKDFEGLLKRFHLQLEEEQRKRKETSIGEMEMLITLESPFRPRTVGANSQNHALNGIIQQICMETGQDFKSTKEYIKSKAVGMGYPMLEKKVVRNGRVELEPVFDWYGNIRGISEADSSIEQCSILIDCAIQLATELGIQVQI